MMICTLLLAYFDFCAVWFFLSKIEFVPANFVIIQITDFSCWFILRFPRPYNVFQGHVITPQLVHYQWVVPLGYLFSFSCLRQLIHPQSLGPLLTKQNNYFVLQLVNPIFIRLIRVTLKIKDQEFHFPSLSSIYNRTFYYNYAKIM